MGQGYDERRSQTRTRFPLNTYPIGNGGHQQSQHIGRAELLLDFFPGNILLASHDHELLQTTCNRVIEFQPDGTIIDRLSSYDDYVAWKLAKEGN